MGFFNSLNNQGFSPMGSSSNKSKTFTFNDIPTSLAEMQALPEAQLTDPFATAALTVVALCNYPINKDVAIQMLNFLKGPAPLSPYEIQFIRDRFMDGKDYIPRSYFNGATPQNNYQPTEPYSITITENPYSRQCINEGYLTLYLSSGGADSPRDIRLRTKPSTGQWFLNEQHILVGIRMPEALDPWA